MKKAKVGVYGEKDRKLQRRLAYERVSQTWKTANVYMYLGSRDSAVPEVTDVQVTTFMEVPDRAYREDPIEINIYFEPLPEQIVDYSALGVITPMGDEQIIKVHINSYEDLGRPIRSGDVLEIPFFKQDHEAFWEVVDVDRGQEFEKFYAIVKMKELSDSRETREIPISGSSGGIIDDIMNVHNDMAEEQVPHNGVDDTFIENGETNEKSFEDFDGRESPKKSFLDDFDGDLI